MSEQKLNRITFLLASVAGFCDTATFVAGNKVFSAHVTGNFVLFAAQLALGKGEEDWIRLMTFPVFFLAVIAGGWIVASGRGRYSILITEGILLLAAGLLSILYSIFELSPALFSHVVIMLVVLAMGLQSSFGKLFAAETYGPTTVMTGNVTQAALDIGNVVRSGWKNGVLPRKSFCRQAVSIGGFLMGCIAGAVLARWTGLSVVVVPGVALILCYLLKEPTQSNFGS